MITVKLLSFRNLSLRPITPQNCFRLSSTPPSILIIYWLITFDQDVNVLHFKFLFCMLSIFLTLILIKKNDSQSTVKHTTNKQSIKHSHTKTNVGVRKQNKKLESIEHKFTEWRQKLNSKISQNDQLKKQKVHMNITNLMCLLISLRLDDKF